MRAQGDAIGGERRRDRQGQCRGWQQDDRCRPAREHLPYRPPDRLQPRLERRKRQARSRRARVDTKGIRRPQLGTGTEAHRPSVDDAPALTLAQQGGRPGHQPGRKHLQTQPA